MQDAESRASQAVPPQRGGVVGIDAATARRGNRVVRILARDDLEHRRRVLHRTRHGARNVRGQVQRHDADAAHRPIVDCRPTSALCAAGPRIELPVSLASAIAANCRSRSPR